ncbi:hypothetical protein JCM3770_004883 [Rhodotorula araucariae]
MLPRSARAAAPATKRNVSSAALDRLSLDIFAAHNAEQERASGPAATSKSAAARRGEAFRGDVQLPKELQLATNAIVEGLEDKTILRNHALELYARLQRTSGFPTAPQTQKDRQSNSVTYDAPTSLAYLAGLMPQVYAATLHVLDITKQRMGLLSTRGGKEAWEPERLVDYGSGTGSAAWAFEDVWGVETPAGTAREYVGLDPSQSMVALSSGLFGALPLRLTDDGKASGTARSARLDAKAHQLAVPASITSLARLQLSPKSTEKKRTLALAAFSLGELKTREKRKDLVRAMWDSGAEVIIVIDRGTPAGSSMVVEAREQLLMFGRREAMRAKGVTEVEVDQDLLNAGFEVVPEVAEEVEVDPSLGSFVVAPCPHDTACPLHRSTKAFCHFSQRVKTPAFLRHTKHSSRGEEDAKFSYVVIKRGQRPVSPAHTSAFSGLLATLEKDGLPAAEGQAAASVVLSSPVDETTDVPSELAWPRLIAAPKKRTGHIIMEVCTATGEIERHTIPKSQGRQAYYDARKAAWGDTFPHAPKNGPQPSPTTAPSSYDGLGGDDNAPRRNKFGGDPKQRGTKAERELGKRAARALREEGRRERSAKRASKRGGGADGGSFGGFAAASGVVDVELDFGSDGQLHARR